MIFSFFGSRPIFRCDVMLVSGRVIHPIWSNYSDLTWPHTKWWWKVREIPLFQGNLGWWNIIIWPDPIQMVFLPEFLPPSSVRVNRRTEVLGRQGGWQHGWCGMHCWHRGRCIACATSGQALRCASYLESKVKNPNRFEEWKLKMTKNVWKEIHFSKVLYHFGYLCWI